MPADRGQLLDDQAEEELAGYKENHERQSDYLLRRCEIIAELLQLLHGVADKHTKGDTEDLNSVSLPKTVASSCVLVLSALPFPR